MGTPEVIDINKEIEEAFSIALSPENREKYLCLLSLQTGLDAINSVLIFKSFPDSIFVAGAKEWAESGRTISKENITCPIKVLLPCIEMKDKGIVFEKTAAKEAGIVLYGKYPSYEFKYAKCFLYDYMQTMGEPDDDIEEMPKKPDFVKALREEDNVSIEYTQDEMYLRYSFSYFDRVCSEEEVLYIREDISEEQENIEIIKAFLDHRYDVVLNYGFITTGEREEYKKKVIKAVLYAIMCRYRLNKSYQDLIFISEIDKLSLNEKVRYFEDVMFLLRSTVFTYEGKRALSLNEIIMLRGFAPPIIVFSNAKRKAEGKSMILTYLKKITVECSAKENEKVFSGIINGLYDKISSMTDEAYDELIENVRNLKICCYPQFYC